MTEKMMVPSRAGKLLFNTAQIQTKKIERESNRRRRTNEVKTAVLSERCHPDKLTQDVGGELSNAHRPVVRCRPGEHGAVRQ